MVTACAAFGCRNKSKGAASGRSFHCFPKDPEVRVKWIRALRRKDFTPGTYTVICSDHFLPEDYIDNPDFVIRKLKSTAVPTRLPTKSTYPGGRKRRLSEGEDVEIDDVQKDDDILSKIIIIPLGTTQAINMDHSYAFPSNITLAKLKHDRLQSLLAKKLLVEEKQRQKIRQLKSKNKQLNQMHQVKFKNQIRMENMRHVKFKSRKERSRVKGSF
nr:THAP domain-containing protein 1-like isoform X2 [Lepeophtheirus salmonis]